jgi:hypothetical protein
VKRTRIRRMSKKRAGYTTTERRALDKLAREVVFARDCGQCQLAVSDSTHGCAGRLEWCHVDSRTYRTTRWLPDNSLVLCSSAHRWWHNKPREAVAWWIRTFPNRCDTVSKATAGPKSDFDIWKRGLSLYLESLTASPQSVGSRSRFDRLERGRSALFAGSTPDVEAKDERP